MGGEHPAVIGEWHRRFSRQGRGSYMRAGAKTRFSIEPTSGGGKLFFFGHNSGDGFMSWHRLGFSMRLILVFLAVVTSSGYGFPDVGVADVNYNSATGIGGLIIGKQPSEQLEELAEDIFDEVDANIAEANAVETGTERELSTIERLFSGEDPEAVPAKLRQFGYDVFRGPVSTFAPVTNVPVGPDYVIGPGDSFTVTLWGRVNVRHTIVVDRNGEVALPEVGVLKVWGMNFGALHDYLEHEFSRKYTDFKMAVTMARLRTIRVYVVGEVQTPGSYTLSSLSTVINALFAAGGPSQNGTLRKIRLLKNGGKSVIIDLYDFLLGGEKSEDARLQDGDTVLKKARMLVFRTAIPFSFH